MFGNKIGRTCIKFIVGCPRNKLDAIRLYDYLCKNNWSFVNGIRNADLILVGLCGFDDRSERISKNFLKMILKRKEKGALVVPFGCLSDIKPQIFDGIPNVCTINYQRLEKIDEILNGRIRISEIEEPNIIRKNFNYSKHDFSIFDRIRYETGLLLDGPIKYIANIGMSTGSRSLRPIEKHDYFIRVARGCTGHCSYCAIKSAAGKLISYPIVKILEQFEKGLSEGYCVFRLLGEDVGGYGQDIGTNMVILLQEIFRRKGNFELVIEDFNPKWLIRYLNKLLKLFKDNAHHIHHIVIPIQSGSQKIVQRMGRGYRVDRAVEALSALRCAVRNLKIATHIIVGFPGETERDFEETIDVLAALNFDHIEAHFYTDRPNCASDQFNNKISDTIKIWRLWRLRRKFADTCRVRI